jgi:HNH endonuclease
MTGNRRKPPTKRPGRQATENRVYGRRFQRIAKEILAREPVCRIQGPGCSIRATLVDHIRPWQDGGAWYDLSNLQPSCRSCNTWKRYNQDQASARPALRFPPKVFGDGGCPHRALDGSGDWCVGPREKGHWTRWWLGSPEAPYWGPDDPRQGSGGVIA